MLSYHLEKCKEAGFFFECRYCDLTFTSKVGRGKHVNRVHAVEEKVRMNELVTVIRFELFLFISRNIGKICEKASIAQRAKVMTEGRLQRISSRTSRAT